MKDLHSLVWSSDRAEDGRAPEYLLVDGDPNGSLEGVSGSLAVNPATGIVYVKTSIDATSWATVTASGETPGRLVGFQLLTGTGTYVPTDGAVSGIFDAVGGGASGGGVDGDGATVGGASGGGSGARAFKRIAVLDASYPFSCGAGGAAPTAGANNGNVGGATTLGAAGAVLSVPGGLAGIGYNTVNVPVAVAGAANTAAPTGGDINIAGAGSAFVQNDGNDTGSSAGGSNAYGSGGNGRVTTGNGVAGSGIGTGGGGAFSGTTANHSGGAGANGAILAWEYS